MSTLPIDAMTAASVVRSVAAARDTILGTLAEVQGVEAQGSVVYPAAILPGLFAANTAAQAAVRVLHQAGHVAPGLNPCSDIPLHLLDTPDTRELLELLEKAQAVAERIDAARGRTVDSDTPLLPGESHGTDLAETISNIALRVRVEVKGPQGRE